MNYEYRFISLRLVGSPDELTGPISMSDEAWNSFVGFTTTGWKLHSMIPHPTQRPSVIAVLEREVPVQPSNEAR